MLCLNLFYLLLRVCWQEENRATSMFFLHLPPNLPMLKQSATANGQQKTNSSGAPGGARNPEKPCSLGELPAGFMGKMLVYRSGAIKLKLGDTLYDVSYNGAKWKSCLVLPSFPLTTHAIHIF